MVRRICGRPSWLFVAALMASLALSVPAVAQSTGMVKGVVVDGRLDVRLTPPGAKGDGLAKKGTHSGVP